MGRVSFLIALLCLAVSPAAAQDPPSTAWWEWTLTNTTIKNRKKPNTWLAFGQGIDADGIYNWNPGSLELERSLINSMGEDPF